MPSSATGAAGPDGLDSDTMHAFSDESLEVLAELLDLADQRYWPTSWTETRTVLIPKSLESHVIIAHIRWTRRRFDSQVIVTNSHRLDSFS